VSFDENKTELKNISGRYSIRGTGTLLKEGTFPQANSDLFQVILQTWIDSSGTLI
jgi:hypothetical protein